MINSLLKLLPQDIALHILKTAAQYISSIVVGQSEQWW